MDKARKKNIKRIIATLCAVAVVILLAAMPLVAKQSPQTDGPQASILSGTVEAGSISTELIGGGTLAEEDAVTISVPSAVKLTGYLVSNGDSVSEGDPIASVDRVTVMTAIAQVQETLEHLTEEIETEREEDTDGEVEALADGTVKILYAAEGDFVQDVMLEHGALAVLSLDGLMAVDLTAESDLAAGASVTVTFSDGTAVTGEVVSNLAGQITVTAEDDGYAVGEAVQITTEDGAAVGSGKLYIYSPWNAIAYTGTVDSVNVEQGDTADAGDTLMELSDTGYSAAYHQLLDQHREYEELMLELFQMYQTEVITAPCDGIVSGVDENSIQLLSANTQEYVIRLLANSPDGNDQILYSNYVGQVNAVAQNGWVMNVSPEAIPIADYKELSGVPMDTSLMTQTVLYTQTHLPVYALTEGTWVQIESSSIAAGDILLFAADEQGNLVWSVLIRKAAQDPSQPTDPNLPADPSTPTDPSTPADSSTPTEPGTSADSAAPTVPDGTTGGTAAQPSITYPSVDSSWGSMSGYFQSGMTEQEQEFELYDLDVTQIAAVTPQSTMTVDITVDELDITQLQLGMTAQIKIDALGGEKFTAAITDISNTGTNSGGSSKFTVELTLDRGENMLAGMNATATITLSTASDILTLPADALVENGTQTVVYTGYDEENEVLINPVPVTTGVSDGQTVEILSGLSAGTAYYYAYYDTLEVSFTPDFGSGFLFGQNPEKQFSLWRKQM